jgi:anti-sigma regulatory factor (Ser/Thr protein kinase)
LRRGLEADAEFGGNSRHGDHGPIPVTRYPELQRSEIHLAALQALDALGFPTVDDHNAPIAVGVGRMPMSSRDGVRVTSADAYLPPDSQLSNLAIRADSTVAKVVVEAGRATGVQLVDGTEIRAAWIVLAAGTYGSPDHPHALGHRTGRAPRRARQYRARMTRTLTLRLDTARLDDLARIRAFVRESARSLGASLQAADDLVIAVDEAATNTIRHGYEGRPGPIDVEVVRSGSGVVVRLVDDAPVFDPTGRPAPDLDVPLESRPFGGMGIHLMRVSVDRLVHRGVGRSGNDLTFFKDLAPQTRRATK